MRRWRFNAGIAGHLRAKAFQLIQCAFQQLALPVILHARLRQCIADFLQAVLKETQSGFKFGKALFRVIHELAAGGYDRAATADAVIRQTCLFNGLRIIDITAIKYGCIG